MITIDDVLQTKAFDGAKVVGGRKGLHNKIKNVTVAEVPDSANWLHGGELICTTAYFISKEVKYQVDWIKSLSENGASALAIKSDRFLGKISESIISIADSLNLPIIEMSPKVTWPEVIESVMHPILNNQIKTLQRAEEIHTKLTSLVLEDQSVNVIANEIASLIGSPIIIEDARFNHITTGNEEHYQTPFWKKCFQRRLSNTFCNKVISTTFYQNVIQHKTGDSYKTELTIEQKTIENIIIPIVSNQMTYGFITLMDEQHNIQEIDQIALKHGAAAVALQLMKMAIHKQTLQNKYLALIDDLIHGRIHSELVNEYRIRHNVRDQIMSVAVVDLKLGKDVFDTENIWNRTENQLIDIMKGELINDFDEVIIGNSKSLFTIIVFHNKSSKSTFIKDFQIKLIKVLNLLKSKKLIYKYSGGIGNQYSDLKYLGKSFKEANTTLSIVNTFSIDTKEPVLIYEKLGIHRIISMVNDYGELNTFCKEFLGDLIAYDEKNNDVLTETLHMYLKSNCVVVETAKKLFIHSNTVSYRLKKIQNIIKHDLSTLEFRLTYLFALEAQQVLHPE